MNEKYTVYTARSRPDNRDIRKTGGDKGAACSHLSHEGGGGGIGGVVLGRFPEKAC